MIIITTAFFFLIKFKGHLVEEAHLHYTEDPETYKHEYDQGVALGYVIVILINLFNKYVISFVTHKITDYEKHISVSS